MRTQRGIRVYVVGVPLEALNQILGMRVHERAEGTTERRLRQRDEW